MYADPLSYLVDNTDLKKLIDSRGDGQSKLNQVLVGSAK